MIKVVGLPRKYEPMKLSQLLKPQNFKLSKITNYILRKSEVLYNYLDSFIMVRAYIQIRNWSASYNYLSESRTIMNVLVNFSIASASTAIAICISPTKSNWLEDMAM